MHTSSPLASAHPTALRTRDGRRRPTCQMRRAIAWPHELCWLVLWRPFLRWSETAPTLGAWGSPARGVWASGG